jgi:hypothetical protein
MVKFASHRFQGIAGRSNIERPTSNIELLYTARRELPFESLRIFDGVERSILIKSLSEAIPSFDIRHSSVLRFAFNVSHEVPGLDIC